MNIGLRAGANQAKQRWEIVLPGRPALGDFWASGVSRAIRAEPPDRYPETPMAPGSCSAWSRADSSRDADLRGLIRFEPVERSDIRRIQGRDGPRFLFESRAVLGLQPLRATILSRRVSRAF
jgi:hypothetical protein